MHCTACRKKSYESARDAMVALASACSLRAIGDPRREVRFYPCPATGGFHLTSEAAPSWDSGKFVKLSRMIVLNHDRVLSRA
jgi:hypothetical protein